MKTKLTPTVEIINLSETDVIAFKEALKRTEQQMYIQNTSIKIDDNGTVTIADTRAAFLLNLGMNYCKVLNNE